MAKISRLKRFAYQSIVDEYAMRYGLDPDKVFVKSSMDSVIGILEGAKEKSEFNERFNHLWSLMTK